MLSLRVPIWRIAETMEELRKKGDAVSLGVVEACSCPCCGWVYLAPDSGYAHDHFAIVCPWWAI